MEQLIKYKLYTAEQLATDYLYMEWVFHPFSSGDQEWVKLFETYPAIIPAMLKARQYLRRFAEGDNSCLLIAGAMRKYVSMKNDIALAQRKKLRPATITEKCFSITQNYWAVVRADLLNFVFENTEHEIHFVLW